LQIKSVAGLDHMNVTGDPMSKIKATLFTIILLFSTVILAAVPEKRANDPQGFQLWKEHQVVEARNRVVRLTNRMHLLKTGRYKLDTENLPLLEEADERLYKELKAFGEGKEAEKAEIEQVLLSRVEAQMQTAIENLQIAKDLGIEDYIEVYLSRYQDDEESLKRLLKKLSQDEILQILQSRLKSTNSTSAVRTSPSRAILSNLQQ